MKPSQKELFRWADQIPATLWTDLRNRSPQQAAEAVGAEWELGELGNVGSYIEIY